MSFIGSFSNDVVKIFSGNNNDDKTDKLCRKYTAIMVLVLVLFVKPYKMIDQIKCWCPNDYSGDDCSFATSFCYISDKYIPTENNTRLESMKELFLHKISYYQWTLYLFLLVALLFYTPKVLWSLILKLIGYNITDYVNRLKNSNAKLSDDEIADLIEHSAFTKKQIEYIKEKKRTPEDEMINYIANDIYKQFEKPKLKYKFMLYASYMLIKLFYIIIAVLQICLLNYFLRDDYNNNYNNLLIEWPLNKIKERFPILIFCQYDIIIPFDLQKHLLQCILPENIYNDKIFLILWTWIWILLVLFIASFINYFKLLVPWYRRYFLRKKFNEDELYTIDTNLLDNRLTIDAILTLKLINTNTYDYFVKAIVMRINDIALKKY